MLHLASIIGATTTSSSSSSSGGILGPIAKPVADVLAAFYHLVPNYGVAILLLSVAWMLLISPLTLKSTRSMLAMQKLQPELKKLQAEHKNDRQAFSQAQMQLFKERGVSPFGSCLPTILPLPIFFALFKVIDGLSNITNGHPAPKYLSPNTQMYKDIVTAGGHLHAFGLDLSKTALTHHTSIASAIPFYLLLLIMMGTQYFQTSQMMSRNSAANANPQMAGQQKIMKFLPLIFGLFCLRFPAGVVLYYAMSNVCRIVQQELMYRYDPKVKALTISEVNEIEATTREIDERSTPRRGGGGVMPLPAGGPAPTGRSRFRDLLASAAEQQQATRDAKAAGNARAASPPKGAPTPSGGGRPTRTPGGTPTKNGSSNGKSARPPAVPAKSSDRTGGGGTKPRTGAGTTGSQTGARKRKGR